MTRNVKIAIWAGGILTVGALTGFVIVPTIRRHNIRKRLNEIFADPTGESAAGGMDKLLVKEAFNTRLYQTSGKATISLVDARERSKQIWDNYSSWFASNETAIVSAFNGLGHLHDVSKISHEFQESYGEELLEVLTGALESKGKMNILIGKLAQLPSE